ncbi:MAG: hypothetical protein JWP17_2263 [Solirubrobacterales bacterium]|jgi:hypothetical protein|nr:hypothetical protein [Solirubrobacterales bacterium]
MPEVQVTLSADGGAYVRLSPTGEVRTSVALEAHEESGLVPTLQSIVLDFDHYGRLIGIDVINSAAAVLPPALLDAAVET